ncbi:Na+/H+ antiporter NhaA [Selenomonas sp. TAMA-11512]|uniref:Na+/H+ antiporter NhaA n=1 Tax=Selenomonas sp. TAMA-11512 TaxID=3095337 RepID=UPI0030D03E74
MIERKSLIRQKIAIALGPIQAFFRYEASSGILLLFFAVLAMILANSPWAESYESVLALKLPFAPAEYHLDLSVLHLVNDGLMAIFFFVIGLEIKREFFFGELQSLSATILPICAALGGMLIPAFIYVIVNAGGAPEAMAGWGIPMATDIAFSLGILAIVAQGVPIAIVIFLTALAIVDDLGAIIVIALFYTSGFSAAALFGGLASLGCAFFVNRKGVKNFIAYLIFGLIAWLFFLNAGIHPTIAGVVLAFAIPIDRHHPERSVLYKIEHALEPWSAYVIMPIFALANAGVRLPGDISALLDPIALGIVLGLCIGKPLGICCMVFLFSRVLRLSLPTSFGRWNVLGSGCLAGIGFTMSLFIASLAFPNPEHLATAKLGIIAASLLSGTLGALVFLLAKGRSSTNETNMQ